MQLQKIVVFLSSLGYGVASNVFTNEDLKGRFSYFNTISDVASLTVGVFDGTGHISEMEDVLINAPIGNGEQTLVTLKFNYGYYEVHPSGRGKMFISLGEEGGPYYDPPAEAEFVVTGTNGREITALESFLMSGVGVADQLVAPSWKKIADE